VSAGFLPAAEPPPLPAGEQARVNDAIDRGMRYLQKTQGQFGTWAKDDEKHKIGYTALPALTLLECGASKLDPGVQRAAALVRQAAPTMDGTYELALSILFLDRLGEAADRALIRTFATRLIAGQTTTGGWGYRCPILTPADQKQLLLVLEQLQPQKHIDLALLDAPRDKDSPGVVGSPTGGTGPSTEPGKDLGSPSAGKPTTEEPVSASEEEEKQRLALRRLPRAGWCLKASSEDFYTSSSAKGASNPGAPDGAKPPPRVVIPQRFRGLPVLVDPTKLVWQDLPKRNHEPLGATTDNSNTQFAMLALWAARRHEVPVKRSLNLLIYRFRTSQNGDGRWGYAYRQGGGENGSEAMTCVGLIGLAIGHRQVQEARGEGAAGVGARDQQLVRGFVALSNFIGRPLAELGPGAVLRQPNLYFLWSVERVGVLYGVPKIGGKDWYRWGAQVLVANQQGEGNWTGGLYHGNNPVLDTCFALLFLKRANLTLDLTEQLPISSTDLTQSIDDRLASLTPDPPTEKSPPDPSKEPAPSPKPPDPLTNPSAVPTTPTEQPGNTLGSPPNRSQTDGEDSASTGGGRKKVLGWIFLGLAIAMFVAGGVLLLVFRRNGKSKEARPARKRAKKQSDRD
jgi:hypothetical protein